MFDFIKKWINKNKKNKNCIDREYVKSLYIEFLRGYINNEMIDTDKIIILPDNITYEEFMVVRKDNTIIPKLHGALSKNILVPKNIKVIYDDIGHNNLMILDNYEFIGSCLEIYIYDIPDDIILSDIFQDILIDNIIFEYNRIIKHIDTITKSIHLDDLIELIWFVRVDRMGDIDNIVRQLIELAYNGVIKREGIIDDSRWFLSVCSR